MADRTGLHLTAVYAIGLGANRARPKRAIEAALKALAPIARSRVVETPPLGPRQRRYANAAALIESDLEPPAMLARLKRLEVAAGRRPGQRWGPRALDLDVLLWSGGVWADDEIAVPHSAFRTRRFVLAPLAEIAPDWRDPLTGLTVRQLKARLDRARPAA